MGCLNASYFGSYRVPNLEVSDRCGDLMMMFRLGGLRGEKASSKKETGDDPSCARVKTRSAKSMRSSGRLRRTGGNSSDLKVEFRQGRDAWLESGDQCAFSGYRRFQKCA